MKYYFLLPLIIFFFGNSRLNAQDFDFGNIDAAEVMLQKVTFDSTANAVVLREFGTASIQVDSETGQSYISYLYHVKLKIFNKEGTNQANIQIPLYIYSNDRFDQIRDLKAVTYNFNEGMLTKTELDAKKVFSEKKSKYLELKKFTMPNIKDGSIIEYSYTMQRPYIFNFVTWEFQADIPKLHSEFIGVIPPIYNFNASIRGFYKLTSQKGEISRNCLRIRGVELDCSKLTYIMKDVPAFIGESYMTAASNFKSAIYFELSDTQSITGQSSKITKTWKNVDYELTSDRRFGGQMKRKDLFTPLISEIIKDKNDELSKAKAIFGFIKKTIKWNHYLGKYSENEIKKAMELHSGNIGDINLALIAALSAAGLDAEALVLSTRDNGTINDLYPVISDFNYVVAKVNIDGKSYLLDASQTYLPFGLLAPECLNTRGRVINLKKESYWYNLTASQKDAQHYHLDATLQANGNITGTMSIFSSGYSALAKRQQIAEAGTTERYVEKLDEGMPHLKIIKQQVNNVDSLEEELQETYEIEMLLTDNMNVGQLYLNPYFIYKITKNPFNLNERLYPVDLGALTEKRVNISLKLPANFVLLDKPKDISLTLPEGHAKYINRIGFESGQISLIQVFQLNQPVFQADEYLTLKEFYSRIIQQQNTDIILKKVL
ncbi:DUF3857 domain-containing protein [Pedobacter sp.]|uniref:DUF3857 domain-containing protein n=1 Tax=Pedobacter sp. TaxID=1411316 RepID=UPI003D7FEACE